jgi:large subunit ribosomal protein L10
LAITKKKKQKMVSDYAQKLSGSQAIILSDYRGLTVASLTTLRQKLHELNSGFQVVKNTLFEHVLGQADTPIPEGLFQGPTALSFCFGDVPPVVRALIDSAAENEILQIKGAIWGTTFLDAAGAKALANLPSREALLGQLLGAVQGPMGNLVGTVAAPMRELVQVLAARGEQGQQAA